MKGFWSLSKLLLLLLVAIPCLVSITSKTGNLATADAVTEEDAVEDEEDNVAVEDEDGLNLGDGDDSTMTKKNVHRNADTFLLFTNPATYPDEAIVGLPAGKIAEFLVGFRNKGDEGYFILGSVDASLHYPMDYSIHLQNFSSVRYQKEVKAGQEATVSYSFIPADAFAGRPIGLTINLNYEGPDGAVYVDPVFNRTVQITEYGVEGIDTEVIFMYIFLVFGAFAIIFLIYTFAMPRSKGKKPVHKKPVETGTANDDVDYEWIPKSALQTPGGNKSSGTTPRQRKGGNNNRRNNPGSDTE